jgi:hypothetical protein
VPRGWGALRQPVYFVKNIVTDFIATRSQRRLSPALRAAYSGGLLDAEKLIGKALRRAGRKDFSNPSFIEPLKRLLHAYATEAELSYFGRHAAHFDMMRCLDNLLRLDAAEEETPDILSRPIARPLFITGLPRSATTFLHTLLSLDPANAVPRCWQLIYPYPSQWRLWQTDTRRARVEFQLRMFRWLSPGVENLHPLTADTPQECTDITAQVFQSLRFDSTHRIPSYQSWLDGNGHLNAFRFHRRFLQHLDSQSPGHRWVLKSPDHVFSLDAIRTVYPDAQIVFLHRDPLSVVASCCKLAELLRRPFTRHIDREEIGRQVSNRLVESTQRMMAAAAGSQHILHLHYADVVSAPMEATASVYHHGDIGLTGEAKQRMQAWLSRPRERPSRSYNLAEFGLDPAYLRTRFAPYVDAFGVAAEWTRSRAA